MESDTVATLFGTLGVRFWTKADVQIKTYQGLSMSGIGERGHSLQLAFGYRPEPAIRRYSIQLIASDLLQRFDSAKNIPLLAGRVLFDSILSRTNPDKTR